jgi:hypothetical protein
VGHWQGTRARYLGQRKNLFDLRRVTVVHNLHLIDRRPDITDRQPPPARQAAQNRLPDQIAGAKRDAAVPSFHRRSVEPFRHRSRGKEPDGQTGGGMGEGDADEGLRRAGQTWPSGSSSSGSTAGFAGSGSC